MKECHCPEECEKLKYSSSLSSAYFPSFHFWDTVFQLLNISTTNNTEGTKSKVQESIRLDLFGLVRRAYFTRGLGSMKASQGHVFFFLVTPVKGKKNVFHCLSLCLYIFHRHALSK